MALSILMSVAAPETLSSGESAFSTWRTGLGDTVTPVSHSASVPGDLSGTDLVVFGDSMQSNQTYKWDSVNIPVLSLHLGKSLHIDQATQSFASQGDTRLTRWVENSVASSSPTGSVTVYDSTPDTGYDYLPEASLAGNVVIVSRHQSGGNRITSILIPANTELLNSSVCPSRRIVTPAEHLDVGSDALWETLDNYIEWLAPEGPGPDPEADFIIVDAVTGDPLEILYHDGTGWS